MGSRGIRLFREAHNVNDQQPDSISRRTEPDSAAITADRVKELPSKIDRAIVIAVCEDGSQWTFDGVGHWQRLPITPDLRKRVVDLSKVLQCLFARYIRREVEHPNCPEHQQTISQLSSLLDSLGVPRE